LRKARDTIHSLRDELTQQVSVFFPIVKAKMLTDFSNTRLFRLCNTPSFFMLMPQAAVDGLIQLQVFFYGLSKRSDAYSNK